MENGDLEVRNEKVTVLVLKSKRTGKYTLTLNEKGGPIISADSLEEGKERFYDALKLTAAIRNLHFYSELLKSKLNQTSKDRFNFNTVELA
jgi:hypothetical protein